MEERDGSPERGEGRKWVCCVGADCVGPHRLLCDLWLLMCEVESQQRGFEQWT